MKNNIKIFSGLEILEKEYIHSGYIISSYITRMASIVPSRLGSDIYSLTKLLSKEADDLLSKENVKVLVLEINEDEKTLIAGFTVFSELCEEYLCDEKIYLNRIKDYNLPIIHFMFVKKSLQRNGLGKTMLKELRFNREDTIYTSIAPLINLSLPFNIVCQPHLKEWSMPIGKNEA